MLLKPRCRQWVGFSRATPEDGLWWRSLPNPLLAIATILVEEIHRGRVNQRDGLRAALNVIFDAARS